MKELGLDNAEGYHITDLYDDYDYGIVTPERRFKVDVNPSGSRSFFELPELRGSANPLFLGVVMIRCDLFKGKRLSNFVEAAVDAQPRKEDKGLVLDHGHIGKDNSQMKLIMEKQFGLL